MENKNKRKYLIETGMGLQRVDGLKNSDFFIEQANRYINGKITLSELGEIISNHYKNKKANKWLSKCSKILHNLLKYCI